MEREHLNYYLQQLAKDELDQLCAAVEAEADVEIIQKPTSQTLMIPVRDPINDGSFFSGEVLVSSAIAKVNGISGWSMVMDAAAEKAASVALLDGAYAAGIRTEEITKFALIGKERLEAQQAQQNTKINATRVAFDLL